MRRSFVDGQRPSLIEEQWREVLDGRRQLSRREFLAAFAGTFGAAAGLYWLSRLPGARATASSDASSASLPRPDAKVAALAAKNSDLDREKAASTIRNFESEMGNRAISRESGEKTIPAIAQMFIATEQSPLQEGELVKKVFFVDSLKLSDLLKNYPQLDPSSLSEPDFEFKVNRRAAWTDFKGNVFINLFAVNDFDGLKKKVEYSSLDVTTRCGAVTPAKRLRYAAYHEIGHADCIVNGWKPLPDEIAAALQRYRPIPDIENLPGQVLGFIVKFGNFARTFAFTDEFVTDYRMAVGMVRNGLGYSPSYPSQRDISNFHLILAQAGITEDNLRNVHRSGDLENFFLQVAAKAQGVKNSHAAMIQFGTDRFLTAEIDAKDANIVNGLPEPHTLDLASFAGAYPVDTRQYDVQPSTGTAVPQKFSSCLQ